jgi:CDP-glucose 4,6-dehydratase
VSPRGPYADRRVLVTGAQGFIGSWLVDRLLQEGARVIVPRRPVPEESRFRQQGLQDRCEQVELELLDLGSVTRALDEHQVELVFHLAASTVVDAAGKSPLFAFETNVRGTFNLLEACRVAQPHAPERRVVIASSAHVYGKQGDIEYSEEVGLRPSRPYDVSKACADMIARCHAQTYEMPVAVTRLANVYGGGDRNWSRIVPDSSRSLARGERPVIRSDGTPERDWLYVEDAVGVYLAVERSLDDPAFWGRAWNAGSGQPVSVRELVATLIEVSGEQLEPDIQGSERPQRELDRQYLDSAAIQAELGWQPVWTLQDGLRKAYAWYADQFDTR